MNVVEVWDQREECVMNGRKTAIRRIGVQCAGIGPVSPRRARQMAKSLERCADIAEKRIAKARRRHEVIRRP
jgi:hypothetical protein